MEAPSEVDFSVKHPLQEVWTWWYDCPKRSTTQRSWGNHLKRVYTFNTVEDFWCLWNNIKPVNEMPSGSTYHLFKQGIEPKWEDSANKNGGKWMITFKSGLRDTVLPQQWLNVVLAVIGAEFEDSQEITGVVACIRASGDRIAIWTANAADEAKCFRIGQKFKEILGVSTKIGYQSHADAMSGSKKSNYEI